MAWALFSFSGRLNRLAYWLYNLVPVVLWLATVMVLASAFPQGTDPENVPLQAYVLMTVAWAFSVWMVLALQVKRWHDMNRSGWFAVISLVPYLGAAVALVIGFIRGSHGENRFGDDPLAPTSSTTP